MEFSAEPERSRGSEREERIEPSEVELIRYRDGRTPLKFALVNGDTLEGSILWYDRSAIKIVDADRTEITVRLSAIVSYKTRS